MTNQTDFYMPRPKALGWRGLSLLMPSIASAIGFFAFGVLAFGFTELSTLGANFRQVLVLVGSFSLAFGGEVGTLSGVVEIYRKNAKLEGWDKLALITSLLSTFGAFVLAFASLLGVNATWSNVVKNYGPILLGILAALDSYSNFLEFGLYLGSYDKRLRSWQEAKNAWQRDEFERQVNAKRQLQDRQLNAKLAMLDNGKASNDSAKPSDRSSANADLAQLPGGDNANLAQASNAKSNDDKPNDAKASSNAKPSDGKQARIDQVLACYADNPLLTQAEVARQVGIGRSTVGNYLRELEEQSVVKRNGQGVEVLV